MDMRRLKPVFLATLALLAVACSSESASPGPSTLNGGPNGIVAGTVEATVSNGVIKLRNTTEHPVGYVVVDRNTLMASIFPATYPPCSNQCPANIKQGETVTAPFSQILGYTPQTTEVALLWWKYSLSADGTRVPVGSMNHTNVDLK